MSTFEYVQRFPKTVKSKLVEDKIDIFQIAIHNETTPISKSQREWAEKLNPLPVSTLNDILDKVSLPRKGNKFMKVMRLATEVEPRDLNKLFQAALPNSYKSQSASTTSESSSAAAGKVEEQKEDKPQTHSKGRASKEKQSDTVFGCWPTGKDCF